jgi:hypothetical protein
MRASYSVIALLARMLSHPMITPKYLEARAMLIPILGLESLQALHRTPSDLLKLVTLPVARHEPDLSPRDWVAYRDCSIHKQLRKDVTYEGRAKVLKVSKAPKDSATAEWYEPDLVRVPWPTSH